MQKEPTQSKNLAAEMRDEIKMPPELQEPYEKVVLAGLKIMFSQETHEMAIRQMEGDGPLPQRLGDAIAGLMVMLFQQSNNTLPPQLVMPVALALLTHAVDFFEKSGEADESTLADATVVMLPAVVKAFGGDDEQVAKMFGGFDNTAINQQAGILSGGMSNG